MGYQYDDFKEKAYSALRQLAKESPSYADAQMLVGSADTTAHLARQFVRKSIDTEWVEHIEAALPALDLIVRNPTVMIADEEEIVPVELTKRISEKSIKHLAQHTNLILSIEGDEVTPSKLLNVFHEETLLTYENRFINTLLIRLSAFVEKRYRALIGGSGIEQNFKFDYQTEFEHYAEADDRRNSARINLRIELTSPLAAETTEADKELNAKYAEVLARVKRISQALNTYMASPFVQRMGKAYIRPPVIRTNAILKNKNFKECLLLWEFIESFDKVGYSFVGDEFAEKPADNYVTDLYTSVALQYAQFYTGIVQEGEDVKMLSQKRLFETFPDFSPEVTEEELEDYLVYDSEYRKTVPVSRLMNNKKKLSEDELRIREAIIVALRADDILTEEIRRAEEEARRLERERREREEEEKRRALQAAAAAERGPIEIRYKRSYLSRLIQASDELQDYYTAIKNELLSYKKVVSRISWKQETFKRGREFLSRINVKGKTLYVYLALDPTNYEGKHFITNVADKVPDTPVLVKVKNERSLNVALRLIEDMAEQVDLVRIDHEAEDFHMPHESDEALIEKGLIKIVLPSGVTLDELDETVKADILNLIGERKPKEEVPEAAEEEAEAAEEQPVAAAEAEVAVGDDALFGGVRYRRSYLSRYIQADAELQDYYTAIKNELLSYKKVVSRISWKQESFKRGREFLSIINVKGKSLYVYLAIDPTGYEGKHFITNVADKMPETPLLVKVKNERSLNVALRLIEEMAEQIDLVRTEHEAEDFHMPYESDEALLEKGLIKVMLPDGMSAEDAAKANVGGLIAESRTENRPATIVTLNIAPEQAAKNVVFKDHITGDDAGSPFAYSPQFIIGREPVAPAAEPVQVPYGQGTGSATYAYGPAGGDAPSRSMPFIDEDARALEQAAEAATEQQAAAEAPVTEAAEPVAEEQAPVAEEAAPEVPAEEVAPTKETEVVADAAEEADVFDDDSNDEAESADEQPDDVPLSYEVIDLTDLDFRDADLVQEIDVSMVDNFTYTLEAVKVSEKVYIGRTAYQIKLAPMSAAAKRSYRVRKKNLVFNGDEPRPGVRMPYTREEFAALSRKQRKDAMVDAKVVLEYNRTCAKIALIQIAKTVDVKLVEKLKSLEEQLEAQQANLPVLQRWKECIKEK